MRLVYTPPLRQNSARWVTDDDPNRGWYSQQVASEAFRRLERLDRVKMTSAEVKPPPKIPQARRPAALACGPNCAAAVWSALGSIQPAPREASTRTIAVPISDLSFVQALLSQRDQLAQVPKASRRSAARGRKLDHKTATLTPDKEADIILLDANSINVAPLSHVRVAVATLMERSNLSTALCSTRRGSGRTCFEESHFCSDSPPGSRAIAAA